jgi:hypothetical protein
MLMNKCLNCSKPIEQEDKTRREKKYCNATCRAAYHQKKNAGKKKYVRIETYQKLKEELDAIKKGNIVSAEIKIDVPVKHEIKNEKPKRLEGEDPFDYAFRVNEWKKK